MRPLAEVYPVVAETIGISFIGVYLSEKGATSQLLSVYRSTTQFFPATVVSSWLSISHLPWYGSLLIALTFRSVDDILSLGFCYVANDSVDCCLVHLIVIILWVVSSSSVTYWLSSGFIIFFQMKSTTSALCNP